MAEDDVDAKISEKALKSFLCFLYVGKGYPYYKAKPWNDDDFYSNGEHMQTLEILASKEKTELIPIDKIKLAMDSKLVPRPETLMFALAMCARQKKSEKLRAAAYYFLHEHCKKWNELVLFIKYATYLCKMEESTREKEGKPIGWGRGWKNAVNKWYLQHSAHNLAELVTSRKSVYGWTHKDIFKLSHLDYQSIEVEKRVVIKFVLYGLKAVLEEYGENPDAQPTLRYIERIENFRLCSVSKDVVKKLLQGFPYTMNHIHPKATESRAVWGSLLRKMDLQTILKYIPKMTELGLLSKVSPSTDIVVRTLTCEYDILWCKIMPADILPILNMYESPPSVNNPLRYSIEPDIEGCSPIAEEIFKEARRKEKTQRSLAFARKSKKIASKDAPKTTKPVKRERKPPDLRVLDALRSALTRSQQTDITEPGKRKYLVAVKLPPTYKKDMCMEASLSIALPLLNRDSDHNSSTTIRDKIDLVSASDYNPEQEDQSSCKTEEGDQSACNVEDKPKDDSDIESTWKKISDCDKEVKRDDSIQFFEDTVERIKKSENEVTIFCHEPSYKSGAIVLITKEMDYDTALNHIFAVKRESTDSWYMPLGPWQWCILTEIKYDVFVNVTNILPDKLMHKRFQQWREVTSSHDTRVINVIVSKKPFKFERELWEDVLTVNGFDRHVPFIIEAYVRGLF